MELDLRKMVKTNQKSLIISIRIPIISIRILVDLTRKFWFHFQSEFQLIQPDIFLSE